MTAMTPVRSGHSPHAARDRDDGALYRRATGRLLPILIVCYVVSNLDRINISFAKLQMMSDLGLSDAVYGLGAGLFFIGYAAVEVPSNLMLHRFGARLWISRILLTWGVISAAMSLVGSAWSFYAMRFALGIAEAGLFPGVLYYLTLWYPRHRRATITSFLYVAVPIAGLSGSLLSGLIISKLDHFLGLTGWQWMFILEALPAILLAPVVFFRLPEGLATASWLSAEEKRRLAQNLADDEAAAEAVPALRVLSSSRVWHLGLILFAFVLAMYGVFFFLPTMIHAAGVASPLQVGAVTAIPYAVAIAIMIAVSRSSDRSGERRWHLIGASLVGAVGIAVSVVGKDDIRVVVIGMCLAVGGIMTVLPVFWSLATGAFRGASEATAIAFINSIGLTAGFVGPSIIGAISRWSGSIDGGMLLLALVWVAGAVLVFAYQVRAKDARLINSVSTLAGSQHAP